MRAFNLIDKTQDKPKYFINLIRHLAISVMATPKLCPIWPPPSSRIAATQKTDPLLLTASSSSAANQFKR
jgi:hypothetical protein